PVLFPPPPRERQSGRKSLRFTELSEGRAPSGSEPAAMLHRDQRLLAADLELLDGPRVAVGIGKAEERAAVPFVEDHDLAALDAAGGQLRACDVGIGHAQL